MVELALVGRLGIAGLTALGALQMAAPCASAAGSVEDVQSTLVAISVLSLPLTGLLVLLLHSLPALLGRPSMAGPVAFAVANLVVVTALLTFLQALLVPFVTVEGVGTTISFAAVGVLDLLLVTGLLARYLVFPLPWASVAGGVVATTCLAWAYLAFEMDYSTLTSIEDLLRATLPMWVLVFMGLLFWMSIRHQGGRGDDPGGGQAGQIPRGRRMLRLGEMLIMNMVVALAVWLAWLS